MQQRSTSYILAVAISVLLPLSTSARAAPTDQDRQPARMPDDEFRQGLLKLKLLDLLDYYLQLNPPADDATLWLTQREIKLAVYSDALEKRDVRLAALHEANNLLAKLLSQYPDDSRALDWRMQLARSLVYAEAEPFFTNIVYRGGTGADGEQLRSVSDRAIQILTGLIEFLEAEYARLDELSLRQYERLEEDGYVTKIESATPEAEYLLRWAKFYRAVSLPADSAERHELLALVLQELRDQTQLLTDDHSRTHAQAQSLLLAGMSARLLGDHAAASRDLLEAVRVVDAILEPQERSDLDWVATLGLIEAVRAARDAQRFSAADQVLAELDRRVNRAPSQDLGMALVVALLESSVERAKADDAERHGDQALAQSLRKASLAPLRKLADRSPEHRDEVYAAIYEQIGARKEWNAVEPFEKCAIAAGHIAEASQLRQGNYAATAYPNQQAAEAAAIRLLDEAIALAQAVVDHRTDDPGLFCEARFNLGVAQYQRGLRVDACNSFTETAKDCPRFGRARSAATYAVEIAAELNEDPSLRARPEVRALFINAADTLVEGFAGSEPAEYWRFFLAQALEDAGKPMEAAAMYGEVRDDHPQFLTARFRVARCQIGALKSYAVTHPDNLVEINRQSIDARRAVERFLDDAQKELADDASHAEELDRLRAEARVLLAEMYVLPGVNQPEKAIETLAGFEESNAPHTDLIGRVLRTRVVAFESAGRLEDARQTVPKYMASAPKEAGPTLQALFDATWAEVERLRKAGREDDARNKAASALLFAEHIDRWARSGQAGLTESGLYFVRLQLAEANLEAGRLSEAQQLLRELIKKDAVRNADDKAHDPRLLMAYAEVLFRSKRYDDALPLFNQVYSQVQRTDARHYAALLRDLECRTELGEDASGIINVIKQHRYLNPDLGGDELRDRFARLQKRNEERLSRTTE